MTSERRDLARALFSATVLGLLASFGSLGCSSPTDKRGAGGAAGAVMAAGGRGDAGQVEGPSGGAAGDASIGSVGGAAGAGVQPAGGAPGTAGAGGAASLAGPTTVDEFCTAFNEALAGFQARCFGGTAAAWATQIGISSCPSFARASAEGRIGYDAARATECLAALVTQSCGYPYDAEVGPCALALPGRRPIGGACRILDPEIQFSECVPGAFCETNLVGNTNSACGGTCVAYGKQGDRCGGQFTQPLCATGFSCGNVCIADANDGEPCRPSSGGPRCGPQSYCEGGTDTTDGICRPTKRSGPCTVGKGECAVGHTCPGNMSGAASACVPRKAPGEACTPGNFECGYLCEDGHCALAASAGHPCGIVDNQYVLCARGLYCAEPDAMLTGTCRPQPAQDGPCGSSIPDFRSQCPASSGHLGYCDASTSRCALCD